MRSTRLEKRDLFIILKLYLQGRLHFKQRKSFCSTDTQLLLKRTQSWIQTLHWFHVRHSLTWTGFQLTSPVVFKRWRKRFQKSLNRSACLSEVQVFRSSSWNFMKLLGSPGPLHLGMYIGTIYFKQWVTNYIINKKFKIKICNKSSIFILVENTKY